MRRCASPSRRSARGTAPILLALAACSGDSASPSPDGGPRPADGSGALFEDATDSLGLDAVTFTGQRGAYAMPEVMGGGVALFDADGDGSLDLYLLQGHAHLPAVTAPAGTGAAEAPGNRFFAWRDGRFVDATERSGLGDPGYGMGVATGDVDRDGDLDVYVTNVGPDRLYLNDGSGRFEDATERSGIALERWSSSAAFVDIDRDGWLDLYVACYVDWTPDKNCFDPAARPDYCGPKEFPPLADALFKNQGDGTFRDVSAEAGIAGVAAAGLGVTCEDFDEDGWPDVYVANDAYANNLWINQRDGTFRDEALLFNAAFNMNGQAEAGMGVLSADLDDDGRFDLFMTHLGLETNTLYQNLGGRSGFADRTGRSGLGPSSMPYTGFGTVAFDADLDGDVDIAVANGRVVRGDPLAGAVPSAPWDRYAEPNLFYSNEGGLRFRDASADARAFCAPIEVSRGLAAGDLDGDGDIDLVVTNLDGRTRLLRNTTSGRHWLAVRALDAHGGDAVGARVLLEHAGRRQVRALAAGVSYASSGPCEARFGLGAAARYDALVVVWPDGTREAFGGGDADRVLVLRRGDGGEG